MARTCRRWRRCSSGAGYRTGAFVGAFVLDARYGLSRGFDTYDDRYPQSGETRVRLRRAPGRRRRPGGRRLDSLATAREPWFAWVHLFDPHAPYDAPPEYRSGRAPYDAEVAYTDAMVGRLLDRLRPGHALDRTVIIVTADHGESLGDHGETTHGLFAYESTLAVPLIVSGPGIGTRRYRWRRSDTPTSLPTMLRPARAWRRRRASTASR